MTPRRFLPRPGSLRGRVTLSTVALLAVVLVLLFTAVDLALDARLRADTRTRLTDRVALARQLDTSLPAQQLVNRLRGDGVSAELCMPDSTACVVGDVAPATPGSPGAGEGSGDPSNPARGPRRRGRRPAPAASVQSSGSVLYVRARLADSQLLTLSADTSQITATLSRLVALEVIGGAIALGLAGLLLSRLSRVALRPLDDMTALAHRIAAGDRGRRLNAARSDSELGRTAAAFDAMLDELETAVAASRAAEARMRDFLGDASHELRTPVAGLQASAEMLLREDLDRSRRERLAVDMIRETRRATRLVDDLLDVARLDRGLSLRQEQVDLVVVAGTEVDRARLRGPDRRFRLVGDPVAVVSGDPFRLGQVIANLLDNATHATPPGGSVTVEVHRRADLVTLTVADTGPGVPPQDRERIFERFSRLDSSRSRRTGGAGLGLPIAHGLARAHGGDLRYVERPGEAGACFRLSLRAAGP